ncbi:UNKNOWN [Stylonychia lemnae]|uniref:Uncharacterized protein n=1 Tax=Stylonychia lemnae TaxID=5949 RepID=A0A078A5N8_STYLE|nr:UNKNOWN [Stylonychia lemnae]|eukprot:CDW77560.1 UNKNOWN [Stylonychia lemnae]
MKITKLKLRKLKINRREFIRVINKQKQKQEKRRQIRKQVNKEIRKVEKMFPINVSSSMSQRSNKELSMKSIQQTNSVIKNEKDGVKFKMFVQQNPYENQVDTVGQSKYFNVSRRDVNTEQLTSRQNRNNNNISYYSNYQNQNKTIDVIEKSFSSNTNQSQIQALSDSQISEQSDSPYKKLSEKRIMFKILDKHQQVLNNKKKRKEMLQRVGFTKGMFNDKSLAWELRNNSSRSTNQFGLKVISSINHERTFEGGENKSRVSKTYRDFRLNSARKNHNNLSLIEIQEKGKDLETINAVNLKNIKRNKSQQIFDNVKKVQTLLVSECQSARKDIKMEKKRFQLDEDQLKRLINSQKRQEAYVEIQKHKLQEAENVAKMISESNQQLKKKLFDNALREFKDEEFQEIRSREIEYFLNEDYKKRAGIIK